MSTKGDIILLIEYSLISKILSLIDSLGNLQHSDIASPLLTHGAHIHTMLGADLRKILKGLAHNTTIEFESVS